MKSTREEFLDMIAKYQGILYKVSFVYFKNKTEREDNLQEILYQLWKSFPGIRDQKSIGSWIYAVSINTSISRLKKVSRIEYREKVPELPENSNVMDKLFRSESLQSLLDAIHKLDEVDRSIMLLYLEEKTYEEIAEIMGFTISNVGVRINRAKELLKQNLKKQGHGK